MNWLDKLERKFGRYAIRNLPGLETAWFPYCATECKSHFYYFCTDVLLFDWRIFSTGMGSISL